jgi:hypothetical protein
MTHRFKGKMQRGPFGKVLVKRQKNSIFSFNIQKSGKEDETETETLEENNRWSTLAPKELATNLFITDGNNWTLLAKHLGFTRQEIRMKFKVHSLQQ